MKAEAGFYFVWNENGNAPRYRHDDLDSAITEAKRLARLNRGQRFIVLGSISAFVTDDVSEIKMKVDEIPF